MKWIPVIISTFLAVCPVTGLAAESYAVTRDLKYFLYRLRTVDHLPECENTHTAMSSTWDRSGGNNDGTDFKRIEGDRNILLDVDGPGCIHRIFTGVLGPKVVGMKIRITLDGAETPLFDMEMNKFFDFKNGPLSYPLVFHKTYPGMLFPIPFAKHCRMELVNPQKTNWGNYWQVTYTTYAKDTPVRSLAWPPDEEAKTEIRKTCDAWLAAESKPPEPPAKWSIEKGGDLAPGKQIELPLDSCGVIRELRLAVQPATPEILRGLRMQVCFDGNTLPSVDVPAGHFFGHAYSGHKARFSSLLVGVTDNEAYARFPMPFAKGAVLRFKNRSATKVEVLQVRVNVERRDSLPSNWGRFHATWNEVDASTPATPRFGPKHVPCHIVLERHTRGKYVGTMLCMDWPHKTWWGEGDWLIWTDEHGWPPRYHGTGSEEYFNSGWGKFDRKAVSGFVTLRPGHPTLYSFHLNDAFQFQRYIRVVEEQMASSQGEVIIHKTHPRWTSTAYWYALPAQSAGSRQTLRCSSHKIME